MQSLCGCKPADIYPVSKVRLLRVLSSDTPPASVDPQVLLYAMRLSILLSSETRYAVCKTLKKATFNMKEAVRPILNTLSFCVRSSCSIRDRTRSSPCCLHYYIRFSRMFFALGLHNRRNATQMLRRSNKDNTQLMANLVISNRRMDTWTETEERRRIWCAVLLFDRHVHTRFRFRPLLTTNIPIDKLLPTNNTD